VSLSNHSGQRALRASLRQAQTDSPRTSKIEHVMSSINNLNLEWIPSAYKVTTTGNVTPIKTETGREQSSIKPLVRHPIKHSKKKNGSI